jgi:hypothetical protein
MNRQKSHSLLCISLILLIVVGCSSAPPPTQIATPTQVPPTATPIPIPPTLEASPTSMPPTDTSLPPTPAQEGVSTSVIIVSNKIPGSAHLDLWLEFAFAPGDKLPGSQIDADLNNGSLDLVLPGGDKKTIVGEPHSPTDSEVTNNIFLPENLGISGSLVSNGKPPLDGMSFENYNPSPAGPEIRIPLEKLSYFSVNGLYQITWHSGSLLSNTLSFESDGSTITVQAP